MNRGFIKGRALGELTSCEDDFAAQRDNLGVNFSYIEVLSVERGLSHLLKPVALLLDMLMRPLNKNF